jgi:SAM-dependent methyltransferase
VGDSADGTSSRPLDTSTPSVTRLGAAYSAHHQLSRNGGEFVFVPERLPLLVAAVGGPGREVLDLGCRTGAVSVNFLTGNRVVGMDVDQDALAIAQQRGIEPVWGDIEAPLPFAAASFDAVVAGELLEHVRAPADVVAEVRRVLRPGGTFAGSVPNAYRLQDRLGFLRGQPPDPDPTHLHMYSPVAMRELLSDFDNVRLAFVGGRYRPIHARLLARDLVFRADR